MQQDAPGPVPARWELESDGFLCLDWADGHQSRLSPRRLRNGCPCAVCRDELARAAGGEGEPDRSPRSFTLHGIEAVGRYALSFTWGDGHAAGIYSWPVLRNLCDCFLCRTERSEG